MITFSPGARQKIVDTIETMGQYLYLRISSKGCSGGMFALEFSPEIEKDSEFVDFDDFTLYLAPSSTISTIGVLGIHYEETLIGSRFVFTSDTYESCGCGNSFRIGGSE